MYEMISAPPTTQLKTFDALIRWLCAQCRVTAVGIITEMAEYMDVITSEESSLQQNPVKECVYVAALRGCDRGVAACVLQCRCRAEWPIYILHSNRCLIR